MKNKILLLMVVLAFSGCGKLDEQAYTFITPDAFYKTEADADASCIGIYSSLPAAEYYNMINGLGCVGYTADGRYNYQNTGDIIDTDELMNRVWQKQYDVVRKANTTIYNLEKSSISDAVKNRYVAEAKVLRALAYFRLVSLWGDIPYRDNPIFTGDDLEMTPMAKVYQNLVADLTWAIPYMWSKTEKPRGRATKQAAQILLARIYLTMASSARSYNPATSAKGLKPYNDAFKDNISTYYQNCKDLCNEVISNNSFKLLTDWKTMWGKWTNIDYRNNDEFIWSSQSATGEYEGAGTQYPPVHSEYAPFKRGMFGGFVYNYVTSFNVNDLRYTWGFIWEYKDMATSTAKKTIIERWRRHVNNPDYPATTTVVNIINTPTLLVRENAYWIMCMKKFVDQTWTVGSGAIDMPYFRMAEAYLMFAEAENELNGFTQAAADKIHPVRTRVNLPAYTAGQFTKEQFRGKILDEYLWEFGMEGKDYYDLVRMGQLEERCYGVEATQDGKDIVANPRPRTAEDYWLPYPSTEKRLNSFMTALDRMNFSK